MKTPLFSQGGASEFIRAAERSIASGDLNLALQQIANARSIDPQNEYLDAIVERIDLLASRRDPAGKNGFLQTSLGQIQEPEQIQMTPELQARVKRLDVVVLEINLDEGFPVAGVFVHFHAANIRQQAGQVGQVEVGHLQRRAGDSALPSCARAAHPTQTFLPSFIAKGQESAEIDRAARPRWIWNTAGLEREAGHGCASTREAGIAETLA